MKKAIAISAAVHLALLIVIAYGGGLFLRDGSGGGSAGGEGVSVWVSPVQGLSSGGVIARTGTIGHGVAQKNAIGAEAPSEGAGFGAGNGAGGGTGASAGQGSGGDPALAEIWRKINRAKRYPETAKRRRLEGSPKIEFAITEGGGIEWAKLIEPCGVAELDRAALETVRNAGQLPYYPRPIALAVRYSLDD